MMEHFAHLNGLLGHSGSHSKEQLLHRVAPSFHVGAERRLVALDTGAILLFGMFRSGLTLLL